MAVLLFLARFKTACDHHGVSEEAAVWFFQFYVTGKAHALIQFCLAGNTMAVHAGKFEILRTCQEVLSFLWRTYAADDVAAEAPTDVLSF